jgi:hypothetical protein
MVPQADLRSARLALQTATAKRDALRALIDAERRALGIEIDAIEAQLGRADSVDLAKAELRRRLIRLRSYAKVLGD